MKYTDYLDRVYGCYLGKCIAGTIGAPYEGMKQKGKFKFTPELIAHMLPNDDLDLQVLWLKVLEEKGVHITSLDLAEAFDRYNISWPGEYAVFDKNYRRGLLPPETALYENDFYGEGMGCPIRAEIWGMILPLHPQLASELCVIDGSLDHAPDGISVDFERYWSAMVSMAFEYDDIRHLLTAALDYVPASSGVREVVTCTLDWYDKYRDPFFVRSAIIAEFGHRDCTNARQNMAFTLLCLLAGGGDLFDTAMLACNLGFDTDCTAGNAGALLGLIYGADRLFRNYGISDPGYVLSIDYARSTDRIFDLALDTARVGIHFLSNYPGAAPVVTDAKHVSPLALPQKDGLALSVSHPHGIYIAPGESLDLEVKITNISSNPLAVLLSIADVPGFDTAFDDKLPILQPGDTHIVAVTVSCRATEYISEVNVPVLTAKAAGTRYTCPLGVVGKTPVVVYGPFWQNNRELAIEAGDSYISRFPHDNDRQFSDMVRFYQLNMLSDPDCEYISPTDIFSGTVQPTSYEYLPRTLFLSGDSFTTEDISRFDGPATYYLVRTLVFDTDTTLWLHVSHTDAIDMYIDGEQMLRVRDNMAYTPENSHIPAYTFTVGEHTVLMRVTSRTDHARYGISFRENGDFSRPYTSLRYKIPRGQNQQ